MSVGLPLEHNGRDRRPHTSPLRPISRNQRVRRVLGRGEFLARWPLERVNDATRPHWFEAWQASGRPSLESEAAALALGARWYVNCDSDGNASAIDLAGALARGITVVTYPSEEAWHRAAAQWWVSLASGAVSDGHTAPFSPIPVLGVPDVTGDSHPTNQAASGVSLHTAQDRLTLVAQQPGWQTAWIRVPWDPYWQAANGTPVYKAGPGHLVIWAQQGTTKLRWSVPGGVNVAAAVTTIAAWLATLVLMAVNRRRGFPTDRDRPAYATNAINVFAETVDGWVHNATQVLRRTSTRSH